MKKYMLIMGLITVTALLGTAAPTEKEPPQPQTRCPVSEEKINKALFVGYAGKRIYVCCKECIAAVQKDPAKYAGELESKGVQLEKAQTICPVLGGKIDKKVYTDYNDKRVYFCCAGCIDQFKKEPDKYLKKLEAEGVAPENIPAAADAEKKEAPKDEHKHGGDTGAQTAPKSEHKHGGGGCM